MEKDEKAMWDWLCDDADAWSEYAKKEEEKDVQNRGTNSKFNNVNNRIRAFLDGKHNNTD